MNSTTYGFREFGTTVEGAAPKYIDALILRTWRQNAASGGVTMILDVPGRRLIVDGVELFLTRSETALLAFLSDGALKEIDPLLLELYGDMQPEWALKGLRRKLRAIPGAALTIDHRRGLGGATLSHPIRVLRGY